MSVLCNCDIKSGSHIQQLHFSSFGYVWEKKEQTDNSEFSLSFLLASLDKKDLEKNLSALRELEVESRFILENFVQGFRKQSPLLGT